VQDKTLATTPVAVDGVASHVNITAAIQARTPPRPQACVEFCYKFSLFFIPSVRQG
jgi:hypothetical protein